MLHNLGVAAADRADGVAIGAGHPLARLILAAAAAEGLTITGLPEHTEPITGKGITATTGGHRVLIGNLA